MIHKKGFPLLDRIGLLVAYITLILIVAYLSYQIGELHQAVDNVIFIEQPSPPEAPSQ